MYLLSLYVFLPLLGLGFARFIVGLTGTSVPKERRNMGRSNDFEQEINDLLESFKNEAVKNAVNAFNEGYLLGRHHAEQMFSEDSDEN